MITTYNEYHSERVRLLELLKNSLESHTVHRDARLELSRLDKDHPGHLDTLHKLPAGEKTERDDGKDEPSR